MKTLVKSKKHNYVVPTAKLESSLLYWERFYKIKLTNKSKRLFFKNASDSIQNKKQISAFVHGYVRGLLVDRSKYTIDTSKLKNKIEKFEGSLTLEENDPSKVIPKWSSTFSPAEEAELADFKKKAKVLIDLKCVTLPDAPAYASPAFINEMERIVTELRQAQDLDPSYFKNN